MKHPARDEIFTRIRSARLDHSAVEVPRHYRGPEGRGSVDLFVERAGDYQAYVERVAREDVAALIGARVVRRQAQRLAVPDGFPEEWLEYVNADVRRDMPELSLSELDACDGVITTCSVAIAETGTIVLTHRGTSGRRALSLIPDFHLVVVEERQIVAGVPDAVMVLDGTLPMTWISGPSATSDIEFSRVDGVHGPRTLEVLVVLEEESVADHARRDRGVGHFIDEYEATGDPVFAVVVDDESVRSDERGEPDLVGLE